VNGNRLAFGAVALTHRDLDWQFLSSIFSSAHIL
jgi:hypothetical protein